MNTPPPADPPSLLRAGWRAVLAGGVYVALAVVFVLLLCPLGWLLRRLGVDLLGQRPDAQARSYWRRGPGA